MAWIDTGVNLLDDRFTLADVLARSAKVQVNHLLVISSTIQESQSVNTLCYNNNQSIDLLKPPADRVVLAGTAGIHPHYADQVTDDDWIKLNDLVADKNVVAVGECGLDFNRNFSSQRNQLYVFERQLEMAASNNLGVYLHERDAFSHQVKLLERYASSLKFMVTHCFTGNTEHLKAYLELGCYIGITGWLCDPKRGGELQQAVQHLPLSRLLLETDAPYLFPKTLRPKRSTNEPSNLPYIGEYFANLTHYNISQVKAHAFQNAYNLFFKPLLKTN